MLRVRLRALVLVTCERRTNASRARFDRIALREMSHDLEARSPFRLELADEVLTVAVVD